ncbi:MAG: hypothetical protein J1F11_00585 [Oscillospiraceae bacterium]|nr:hypothetical protein [Oscillospiraceae bacterium]
MCCLFGLIDYGNIFSTRSKNRIIGVLSKECEARGIDATGIAFNTCSGMHIYKRPVAAHKMWYKIPDDARVIMGHTRMTTQGSEKFNYNNHPFPGQVDKLKFALAHNGVLHNDIMLRNEEKLPHTHIQTDSYVAVQLIEKENTLGFDSIRKMAEKTEGSFCYTILDGHNNLYIVKGDNPMALYKFNGFYMYASTDEILSRVVKKLGLTNYSKVNVSCGDILRIDPSGVIEVQQFDFPDWYGGYGFFHRSPYYDGTMDTLIEYAGYFGIPEEDVIMLVDYGYDELEIEEMFYKPGLMRDSIAELKMMEMY